MHVVVLVVLHSLTCNLVNLKVLNVSVDVTVANQSAHIDESAGLRIECAAMYYGQYGTSIPNFVSRLPWLRPNGGTVEWSDDVALHDCQLYRRLLLRVPDLWCGVPRWWRGRDR